MDQEQLGVVVFRLNALETTIEEVNKKLDQLLSHQQAYITDVALMKQVQDQMDKRIAALEAKIEVTASQTTDLRVGIAEKIGPGAISGAVVAGVLMLAKFFLGV